MSSFADLEQLEHLPQRSDDEVEEEGTEAWTDDSEEGGEPDSDFDFDAEEGFDNVNFAVNGGYMEDDSKSVTSDPDVPVKIPYPGLPDRAVDMLDTPEPIKELFKDLASMFNTSSEPLRDGVNYAHEILQMDYKGKFLEKGKETFIKRALVFYKHVATMEKESGGCGVPGTAACVILRAVLQEMKTFHSFIQTDAYHSLVKRSTQRDTIRSEYFNLLKSLRLITSCTEKHLGLGNVGKLHHVALKARWRNRPGIITLRPIELDLNENLGVGFLRASKIVDDGVIGFPRLQTHMHLEFFLRNFRSPKAAQSSLKRKHDQQDAGPDQAGSALSFDSTASDTPGFDVLEELTASRLAFQDVDHLRSWNIRAANNFFLMHRLWESDANRICLSSASVVLMLVKLTAALYQMNLSKPADYVCELLVATLREVYEDAPSNANRIRLCSALGAYTIIAVEAGCDQGGYRAAEDAIDHLKTLCQDDSSKHMLLMAALKLSYSYALCSAADIDKGPEPKTQLCLLRKGIRAAEQAIDLARSTLEKNSTNLDASNILAYALSAKAELCNSLSEACKDLQFKHAKRRAEVEKTRAKMGGSDGRIPIAYGYIDSPYVLKKAVDQTFGSLDDAGAALEECIGIYQALAKEIPHSYDFTLAEVIRTAAEVYHFSLKPKPELSIARFREAISMLEQLSDTFVGLFDGRLEKTNFKLALRLRWESRFEEADHAFEEMVSKHPDDDNKTAVPFWRGCNILGWVFHARAMMCIRTERYHQALFHAERSCQIFRDMDCLWALKEPLAIRGFCKWVMDEGKAEEALRDLEKSVENFTQDEPELQHLGDIHYEVYGLCLALGWLGLVQCALGQREEARLNGEKAVALMRALLSSEEGMMRAERRSEPVEYVLPHLLVLLADTHWQAGRHTKAKEAVEESLQVREKSVESSEGEKSQRMRADGPTRKTALLLKAMMLEKDGWELEAKANRDEAEKIPYKGFLKVLGCFSASETTTTT
ncbi:hypothetical protein CF326_g6685 [Tilletia indica]|nr:hypothetical protein CF326_g6685 [Tilletia indica]